MAYQRVSESDRRRIAAMRDRAWSAGLAEATFSQILKDPEAWVRKIEKAEQDARAAGGKR